MQKCCSKIRPFSLLHQITTKTTPRSCLSSPTLHQFHNNTSSYSNRISLFNAYTTSISSPTNGFSFSSSIVPSFFAQVRNFSAKSNEKKWKKISPTTSKVKKIKIKPYSSFKGRFKTLNDGTIRRWRAGKRHNAHLKSKKAKRRLRKPEIVSSAYAKVMKKLNFFG